MPEPTAPLFFSRCAYPVPADRLYRAIADDARLANTLGGTARDNEPGVRLRFDHAASNGIIEAAIAPRGNGSRLIVSLYADALDRAQLEAFAQRTEEYFDVLESQLGALPDNLVPSVWPVAYAAPGVPPRVLRRADYQWKTASYADRPEDTMGESAALTRPLGVTQFGADVHRLMPGERNCRNHVELHEQEGFLVLSGTCHIEVEGQAIPLSAGDLCVTFPGEEHYFFNASDAPCEVLTFGGPDLFGSGAAYPHGVDAEWRKRNAPLFKAEAR